LTSFGNDFGNPNLNFNAKTQNREEKQEKLKAKKMSVQDEISAMESIWEDLCQNAGDIASPEWHKDVLKEREKNLKSGADSFLDWEDAKIKIRKRFTKNDIMTRPEKYSN